MMFGWIFIIIIVYFMFTKKDGRTVFNNEDKEAEEILKRRFVDGEITEEEYMRMKVVLNK